jgi:hypothetical protein
MQGKKPKYEKKVLTLKKKHIFVYRKKKLYVKSGFTFHDSFVQKNYFFLFRK